MKTCKTCGEDKHPSKFQADGRGGKRPSCAECLNQARRIQKARETTGFEPQRNGVVVTREPPVAASKPPKTGNMPVKITSRSTGILQIPRYDAAATKRIGFCPKCECEMEVKDYEAHKKFCSAILAKPRRAADLLPKQTKPFWGEKDPNAQFYTKGDRELKEGLEIIRDAMSKVKKIPIEPEDDLPEKFRILQQKFPYHHTLTFAHNKRTRLQIFTPEKPLHFVGNSVAEVLSLALS